MGNLPNDTPVALPAERSSSRLAQLFGLYWGVPKCGSRSQSMIRRVVREAAELSVTAKGADEPRG